MSGAPTFLSKGRVIRAIDERLRVPTQAMLDELKNYGSSYRLSQIALGQHGGSAHQTIRAADKEHVDDEFFGSSDVTWWQGLSVLGPERERLILKAYITALEKALAVNPPKRILSFWITGPEVFQIIVHDEQVYPNTPPSKFQHSAVMVFWITPKHQPVQVNPEVAVRDDLWLVAPPTDIGAVRTRYPQGYPTPEPEEVEPIAADPKNKVWRWKVVGY